MTKQAQNFLNLCQMENNSISTIKKALSMVKHSVKQELMQHYGVNNDDALAKKIAME